MGQIPADAGRRNARRGLSYPKRLPMHPITTAVGEPPKSVRTHRAHVALAAQGLGPMYTPPKVR